MKIKNCYSYQDCWNYALALRENIDVAKVKNDIVAICQTTPESFWLNFFDKSLTSSDYAKICGNLRKNIKVNYPAPYLVNEASFFGLTFSVKKDVFIPQRDTEILVEKTLQLTEKYWKKEEKLKVLDIGTGCGNIVISLAKNRPNWNLVAIDINPKALTIAKSNATNRQIKNIQFIQSDLFSNIDKKEKFNVVVSNPPYISSVDYEKLTSMVKEQPKNALVAANDGYFFYQEIFRQAGNFLTEKFLLVVEIGHQQTEKVIKLIIEYFPQAKVSIFPDYAGRARVIMITNNN